MTDRNFCGCNLLHATSDIDEANQLRELGVDWTARDDAGYDAIECQASRRQPSTGRLFQELCRTDDQFIAHCTPLVWGAISVRRPDGAANLQALAQRMLRLVPESQWLDIIAASLHIQLRNAPHSAEVLKAWLGFANDLRVRPLVLQALFRPWREVKQSEWWTEYQLRNQWSDQANPLPHALSATTLLRLVGGLAKEHFPSQQEAKAWLDELNDKGLSAAEYFQREGDPKRLRSLALLSSLALAIEAEPGQSDC